MARQLSNNEKSQLYIHHLVWLDKNIDNHNNQQKLNRLHELDDKIKTFTMKEKSIEYIRNTKSSIIFIISGSLSNEVIPEIHDYTCIIAIFVFCTKFEQIPQLKFSKIRATCTDTDELIDKVHSCMNRNIASIDFSLFINQNLVKDSETPVVKEKSKDRYPIRNVKEDQARFLWFSKFHNFMMELENDDQQAKKEMIAYCRENYSNNDKASEIIDEYENESFNENSKNAVSWYTRNSIVFPRCINKVLASGDISEIYKYRYFIKLLCQQLNKLHQDFLVDNSKKNKLHLYRGERLKLSEILLISKHINDLISFNAFISTTLEEDIAKKFCREHTLEKDYEYVILEIDIDLTCEQSIAFANITRFSRFPEEEEILLSIGSIFRIESVNFDENNQFYRIHLSLSQHDQITINQYIEQTYSKEIDSNNQSILFGKLLFDMGEYEFAIKYYNDHLEYLTDRDNHHRATYLNNIGVCYNEIGKENEAFKYYKAASRMYAQANDHRGLGACYHNIASYYYHEKDYDNALEYALKALSERQEYELEKASTLDLIGCIQLAKRNTEGASDNLRDALRIRLKSLKNINPNHPDIGISYRNLGRLDSKLLSYIDAQNNYLRAEQIFRHNYPKSHPLVIEITQCLEDIKQRLTQ